MRSSSLRPRPWPRSPSGRRRFHLGTLLEGGAPALAGLAAVALALPAGPAPASPAASAAGRVPASPGGGPGDAAVAPPRGLPGDTLRYAVLMQGHPAGEERVWRDPAGAIETSFHFHDRGRGPELRVRVRADERGLPVELRAEGVDYLKKSVSESFVREGARVRWRNQGEEGERTAPELALYVPMNDTPYARAILARALLRAPGGRLPLLPAGEAAIEPVDSLVWEGGGSDDGADPAAGGGAPRRSLLTLYAIRGLGFSPTHVWLDAEREFFGASMGWMGVVREGAESILPRLHEAQRRHTDEWLGGLAGRLADRPRSALLVRGARLFDPRTLRTRPGTSVLVRGERIVAVGPDGTVAAPPDARVIDAAGRTLLPGLFDMHVHIDRLDGLLHIAAGVTTTRDLANDIDDLLATRLAFDEGRAIGPRVIMAGFMDAPGPYAGPTKVLVDTEEEVREWVARYAELGYEQIKMYSSIDPGLVPTIVEAAHEHGLRVSGHVPAFMTAREAVRAGFDEIQHANMLFLNFLGDTLDTRTPLRFTAVARAGAELDLEADSVQAFLDLLVERDVVVDPTVGIFHAMFTDRPGSVSGQVAAVAERLPPSVRRDYLTGGLPVPEGLDGRYRASAERMLDLVAELHRRGVRLVAGTDAIAGFALHRELELYERAGIPAPEVLRIATLGAAEVAGRADALGSIEPGKLADLVLVDGHPTREISALRRPLLVVKDGVLYDPDELLRAIGVAPGGP